MTAHPRSQNVSRLTGLFLAGFFLLALIASLAVHLTGRLRYAQASEQFTDELNSEVATLTPEALRAQLAALAPAPTPELENAARWLMAGAKAVVWDVGDLRSVNRELSLTPTSAWTVEQTNHAWDMVERNRGALDTLQRATPLTRSSYFVAYEELLYAKIPNLTELLNAAYLVNLDARLAFARGDVERGLASLASLSRLTDTLYREPMLIFFHIARLTEKLLLQGIAEVLLSDQPWAASPKVLDRLETLLSTVDLLALGKRLVALDAAVLSLFTKENHAGQLPADTASRLQTYFCGHRKAANYLDLGRQAAALANTPYATAQDRFSPPNANAVGSPPGRGLVYRNAVAKTQLALSQRRLVATALEIRQQGISSCPLLKALDSPDPYVGQPLACSAQGDGSFHLEIPGAAALIDETHRFTPALWILELDLPALPAAS